MLAILFLCLCLGTNVHAGVIATSKSTITDNTLTSESFDEGAELEKISETCLSNSDFEELGDHSVTPHLAQTFGLLLLPAGVETIGLMELRTALNLEPTPPWNRTSYPSDIDFASASTIQEYYDLRESLVFHKRDFDNKFFPINEHTITTAIAYLDKRFPAIRRLFRRRFEEVRGSTELVDWKTVDRMIFEYVNYFSKVNKAVFQLSPWANPKCFDAINIMNF
ncbi:hypothetical protein B9Z55_011537 [Caenorhabditis nigoni]|uniref:Uncharacterized protein n=1 Tax=Caenorhabditis nigoni TaxID=1611254 RepID=A0A2G5UKI3_9PELO|nr:hypothetical protein B9Z55_011537 [Caenorhabditis nigoni]